MLMGDSGQLDQAVSELHLYKEIVLCRSKDTYLEITPEETNKSLALSRIIHQIPGFLGIRPAEVMAFGDNHNDIELLSGVKYGIAVENSIPALKTIAYAVTGSNKEHGVALYAEKFFLLKHTD